MQKIDLGKPFTTLNTNMNRKELFIDSRKADSLKKRLLKELGTVAKSLDNLQDNLNVLSLKKAFNDDYNNMARDCSRKCGSQSQAVKSLIDNLEIKYNDDVKSAIIKNLDERISYLEDALLGKKN